MYVLYCTFIVVPSYIGIYHVSVKHKTVTVLYIFVLLCRYMIDPPCLACFHVSNCIKFRVLSHPADFANPMVPS